MNNNCSRSYFLFLLVLIVGVRGQSSRGDVQPEVSIDIGSQTNAEPSCSCQGSVVAAVIITIAIFLLLALLYWWFVNRRRRGIGVKPDPEAAGRAAYDNPQFQGDDLESQNEGQTRISAVAPCTTTQQTPIVNATSSPQTKVTTTATNATSTLERGKSTLERVMAAVLSSNRSSSSKKSKDDSFTDTKQVIVPLQGHDFTGLGFTVHGNLKEGLFVKEVMSRGPASQSGHVIPGDRVMALTVFTDHIVSQDAHTILSCASPYPVLLHLEKSHTLGSFSSGSLTGKGKFSPSSVPATKLVHPDFRSQSHGDLAKIGNIDIKKMNFDNLLPPSSKSKNIGLGIELPKVQTNKLVQRSGENRHSERAIDVPGVDIRTQSASFKLNIDDLNDDKVELANVQVHRPMSPVFGGDFANASFDLPTFHDAELSKATEKLPYGRTDLNFKESNADKVDPKVKFGIKVFPDIGFMKRTSKSSETDLERGNDGLKLQIDPVKFSHENETDVKTDSRKRSLDLDIDIDVPDFRFKESSKNLTPNINLNDDWKTTQEGKFGAVIGFSKSDKDKHDTDMSKEGKNFEIGIPDVTLPSFNMKGESNTQNFKDTDGISRDENEEQRSKNKFGIEIDGPDINLPSINLKSKTDDQQNSPDLDGDSNKKTKSSDGFKIGIPDIHLPSFNIKSEAKTSGKSSDEHDSEKDKTNSSKNHGFKIGGSDFHLPTFKLKGRINSSADTPDLANKDLQMAVMSLQGPDINLTSINLKGETETFNDDDEIEKSEQGFSIAAPDIHMPSISMKAGVKTDLSQDSDNENKTGDKSKYDFKMGTPDIQIPSLKFKSGGKENVGEVESDNDDEKRSKSKHGFKIGAPDFHLPTFKLKGGAKAEEEVSQESDNEDSKKNKSKHSFNLSAPDIHLPSFKLKGENKHSEDIQEESDKEDNKASKSKKHDFHIKAPNINLPSFKLKGGDKVEQSTPKESDHSKQKDNKSKHGFKIGTSDINIPSFKLKMGSKPHEGLTESDKDSDENDKPKSGFKFGAPDLHLPSLKYNAEGSLSTEIENEDKISHSKKHGFKIGAPDINLPSFKIKSGSKATSDLSQESDDDEPKNHKSKQSLKISVPDINLPTVNLEANPNRDMIQDSDKEKVTNDESKRDINIDIPDINLPSFKLKTGADGNIQETSSDDDNAKSTKPHKKHGFKIGAPDFHLPTFKLKTGAKADGEISSEFDSKDGKEIKSKNSLNIEAPDINMPSFKLKKGVKTDENLPEGSDNEVEEKSKFEEHGFQMKVSDINVPSFSLKTKTKIDSQVSQEHEDEENKNGKSKSGFSIGVPDMHLPSFKIKAGAKGEENDLQEYYYETNDKSKYDFKIGAPDISLPSLKLETTKGRGVSKESDKEEENSKSKKRGFKFGAPDIHLPSFNIKTGAKHHGDMSQESDTEDDKKSETKHSLNLNAPDINLPSIKLKMGDKDDVVSEPDHEDDTKAKSKKHGFKFGAPDIHFPSFNMKTHGKTEFDIHHDLHKEGNEYKVEIDAPTVDLPSVDMELDASNRRNSADESDDKDKKSKSKHNFNFGIPDIHLPSFHLRGNEKSNHDDINDFDHDNDEKHETKHGFKVEMSDIDIPSLSLENESSTSSNPEGENTSNMDFGIETPNLKTLSLKIQGGVSSGNDIKETDVDIEKSKKNLGFKIGMPDIHMPSLNFRHHSHSNESTHIENLKENSGGEIKLVGPDIGTPALNLDTKLLNKEMSYELVTKGLKDPNLKVQESVSELDVDGAEAELRGSKFKLPGFGFKIGEKEDKTNSKEINIDLEKRPSVDLDLHGNKISVPNVSLETDLKSKDKEKVSRKKSKEKDSSSGFGFSLKGPEINLPSFDIRSGKEKDEKNENKKESDDEKKSKKDKKKSKEKSGFNFKFPNFGSKSMKESKDLKVEEKSGKLEYNIQPSDIKMEGPEIKMVGTSENAMKIPESDFDINVKIPDISSEEWDSPSVVNSEHVREEKQPKGSKFGLNFKAPDISMPNINLGVKNKDESIKGNFNSDTNYEVQVRKPTVALPNADLEASMQLNEIKVSSPQDINAGFSVPDVTLPNLNVKGFKVSDSLNGEEDEVEASKWSLNFKGPGLDFPKYEKKSANLNKTDIDMASEDINFEIPNLQLNSNLKVNKNEKEGQDTSGERKSSKSGINFDFNLPDFNLSKYETERNTEDTKLDYDLHIKKSDISLPNYSLKGEKDEIKLNEENLDVEFNIPSAKIGMFLPEYELKTNLERRSDEGVTINLPHYEEQFGIDHTIKGLERPHLNFDGKITEEIKDELHKDVKNDTKNKKFGFEIKTPDFNIPDFNLKSDTNIDLNSKYDKNLDLNFKSPDVPDITATRKDEDNSQNDKNDREKIKNDFGFNIKMPDINMPDFKLLGNRNKPEEIKYDYSLPDELKVEAGNQIKGVIDMEMPNLQTEDIGMPHMTPSNLSKMRYNHDEDIQNTHERSNYSDFDLTVKLPDFELKKSENQPGKGDIALNLDDPDYDVDIATEDQSDYLNITDATKKKRFGFKIKTPELSLPDFVRSSKNNENKEKDLLDKNQSDEMKSYKLKLKTPNAGVGGVLHNDDDEGLEADEVSSLNVKLPRVKVQNILTASSYSFGRDGTHQNSNQHSGQGIFDGQIKGSEFSIPKVSLKKKELSGNKDISETLKYESDEWKMKEIEIDVTPPKVSLLRGKFDNASSETGIHASENVKSGINFNAKEHNVKLPKLDLQRKVFEETDNAEADNKYKLRYGLKTTDLKLGDVEFNDDDPNFVIPEIKMHPGLDEDFKIPNLKIKGDTIFGASITKSGKPLNEADLKWKGKLGIDGERDTRDNILTESDAQIRSSSKYMETDNETGELHYGINKPNDINVSLDSSYLETECDLPEADSDLKKVSIDFPIDVAIPKLSMTKINLEKNMNVDKKPMKVQTHHVNKNVSHDNSNKFGMAFGFQGFKKHIGVDGGDSDSKIEKTEEQNIIKISEVEIPSKVKTNLNLSAEAINKNFDITEDLPEADYDVEFNEKVYESQINVNIKGKDKNLPEEDQLVRRNKLNASDENHDKHFIVSSESDNEVEKLKLRSEADMIIKSKNKKENDEDKSKTKLKLGAGFGFKGFGKSSDSEDNAPDHKISKEPEGESQEVKEKSRSKSKKTFSFKAFGRSSSDTEEENTEAVSENPMKKGGVDEKNKTGAKNSINFGFKTRTSKNSDSEDNVDNEKVEANPHTEIGSKKQKGKGNIGFGFKNKSKTIDVDHTPVHIEISTELKKDQYFLDEEIKAKNKSNISQSNKMTNKDVKYDTKSESEGGEDERMSMDSRGEDGRSKSRYGIGFGFRKNHPKTSSDSECGENYEQKVHLDERGSNEKAKESKSKSLKLGFKGFKNLKGKIQTEINKMRHDSPSSDEENLREDEIHGEKRKKMPKKKDKEKKIKQESDSYLDTSEETALASAASAAKENRRKKFDSKSSSSSSSDSSSDDDPKSIELKKKKKSKSKRKDEGRLVTTEAIEVTLPHKKGSMEVNENITSTHRSVDIELPNIENYEPSHVTVIRSEPPNINEDNSNQNISKQNVEVQSSPRRYVVVREMKLKQSTTHPDSDEVHEIMDRISYDKKIPYPLFLDDRATLIADANIDSGSWGSDSDMEKLQGHNGNVNHSQTSVNLTVSGKQRPLTDSEELKRKAASLGDLSRLHESGNSLGTLLERAASLDLKNASAGHPSLHVRRLQLPDSSATSIDEADEILTPSSAKKLEAGGFLKAAGQWGTLEEALQLGINTNKLAKVDSTTSSPPIISTTIVKTTMSDEGAPVSNIEISGDRGSSITALSVKKSSWDDSFEDDGPPSLPVSPMPVGKTTITVKEFYSNIRNLQENSVSDSSVVVVGNESVQSVNNSRNINIKLNPATISPDTLIVSSTGRIGSSTSINSEIDRYSPRLRIHNDGDDLGGVTVTMVPAESHPNARISSVSQNPPPVPPKPKASRPLSSPPELISYENIIQPPLVTVSHDWMQENGEIVMETSEHNISDEYVTPDSSPQKSMTQITLDGDGLSGYTVTEGTISRTVIISNPDLSSPVSIVQTDGEH